jgi:hypothetical protein
LLKKPESKCPETGYDFSCGDTANQINWASALLDVIHADYTRLLAFSTSY